MDCSPPLCALARLTSQQRSNHVSAAPTQGPEQSTLKLETVPFAHHNSLFKEANAMTEFTVEENRLELHNRLPAFPGGQPTAMGYMRVSTQDQLGCETLRAASVAVRMLHHSRDGLHGSRADKSIMEDRI